MHDYVNILLSRNTDRLFTYRVPDELKEKIKIGITVIIPFRNKKLSGFVVEFCKKPDIKNIKNILEITDSPIIFDENKVRIAHKMAQHYKCNFLKALSLFLPPGMNKRNKKVSPETVKIISLAVSSDKIHARINQFKEKKTTAKMAQVLELIIRSGGTLPASEIDRKSSLKTLVTKGLVKIDNIQVSRTIIDKNNFFEKDKQIDLTPDQEKVTGEIKDIDNHFFLLHGVTGSGKTEIYLRIISYYTKQGKTAIVLVPEISLTPQTVARFYNRFGENVAVLHSSLSVRARKNEWYRILRGEADIVVGARSALFAPLKNLGVIIIDEEHDTSYKQESSPRYNAVTVAGWIARLYGGKLLLGSATPSIEHYYFAREKYLKLLELPENISGAPASELQIVDMRKELDSGNRDMFSGRMVEAMKETLAKNEQVMLLLNRRGMSPFVICRECGYKLKCPNCEVTMTLHNNDMLNCHYCGFTRTNKPICPKCQSQYFRYFGLGIQKVDKEIRRFFPFARILRMDRDSTRKHGSMEAIISKFAEGDSDILLGTQMIAKGHDFNNVGLVGVVSADVALNLPDFRAAERTFSLLLQVAGRTGRRGSPGKVIIQTYEPDNYAISMLKQRSYLSFYEKEIEYRRALEFPPFSKMCRILLQSGSYTKVTQTAESIERFISESNFDNVNIFGPMPAPLSKIATKHRWHIIIKSKDIHNLHLVVEFFRRVLRNKYSKMVDYSIDIDPMTII